MGSRGCPRRRDEKEETESSQSGRAIDDGAPNSLDPLASGEANSYGESLLNPENGGLNTFTGVLDPGNRRIGPDLFLIPPRPFLKRHPTPLAISSRYHFKPLSICSCVLKTNFKYDSTETQVSCSTQTPMYSRQSVPDCFLRNW